MRGRRALNIEKSEKREATMEEAIEAMRCKSEVSFSFDGNIVRMSAKEWGEFLDAAKRGLRMMPRSL